MRKGSFQQIYVVEDEPDVRASLMFQLEADGYEVAGFEDGETFMACVGPEAEGCAIIDVHLPGMSGIAVLEKLASRRHHLATLVVTGRGDVPMAVKAMQLGAHDFLEKPFARGSIGRAVREALEDVGRNAHVRREVNRANARVGCLTQREREVFAGLVAGKLGKQIAIDLKISPRTVEVHRARVMAKLGVSTLSELLRIGFLVETNSGNGHPGPNNGRNEYKGYS